MPTPTPSPTSVVITGDDLLFALPTNKQMSKVQGYRFVENTRWVEGDSAGPQWVRTSPLTKKQRKQLGLGAVRKVKPSYCEVVASFGDWWGPSSEFSSAEYIKAAGYSFRANANRYYKNNKVSAWFTIALVLPPGQAQLAVDDLVATREACRKYTVVTRDGDIERVDRTRNLVKGKTVFLTGDAVVMPTRLTGNGPSGQVLYRIVEAIGDVFYLTNIQLNSSNEGVLSRASGVYNVLADNVAEVARVSRPPMDLNTLTKLTGDPDRYVPLSPAIDSGSVA
jgi:hypothetical protein